MSELYLKPPAGPAPAGPFIAAPSHPGPRTVEHYNAVLLQAEALDPDFAEQLQKFAQELAK